MDPLVQFSVAYLCSARWILYYWHFLAKTANLGLFVGNRSMGLNDIFWRCGAPEGSSVVLWVLQHGAKALAAWGSLLLSGVCFFIDPNSDCGAEMAMKAVPQSLRYLRDEGSRSWFISCILVSFIWDICSRKIASFC